MSQLVQPPADDPGPLCEGIAQAFWSLGVLAEIGQREASLGDIAAVSFAARRTVALTRFLTATVADLRDLAERQNRAPGRDEKVFTTSEPRQ